MTERKKALCGLFLRILCFSMIAALLIGYATYVMTPKYDYGICSMANLYEQPRDSVDVLAVGTSNFYAGVNTNLLWKEYGIAAYNLCSAEQPFWVSYYMIREALKTQRPSVILLDAQPARYEEDYTKPARTILSTFGIRSIENRIGAILACVEKPMDAVDFIFGLPRVHEYFAEVTGGDFAYPPDNGHGGDCWKGYIEQDQLQKHMRPSLVWDDTCAPMNPREEEYARKIFELCRDKNVELLLIGVPLPAYGEDHQYYNTLWELAAEYGVKGVNYNMPTLRFGLNFSTDFADWQHLNVNGSMVFSRKLGEDLKAMYDLPDHRGDEAYRSYDICADQWYEKYPTFTTSYINEK